MSVPYAFRIIAIAPDGWQCELFRARAHYSTAALQVWTRDMDASWTVCVERRMPDKRCLTPRPKFVERGVGIVPFHLTRDQRLANGITMPC